MRANEMYKDFQLRYEGARLQNKTFDEREVTDWLNKSQLALTKERIAPWKNRPQIGYGNEEVRNSELSGLVSATASIYANKFIQGTKDNGALLGPDKDSTVYRDPGTGELIYPTSMFGVYSPLPNECIYILHEDVATQEASTTATIKTNVPTIKISLREEYDRLIYDPNKFPYKNLVWSIDSGAFAPTGTLAGVFASTTKGMTGFNPSYIGVYKGTYSAASTYAVNDNVLYNGVYYRCTEAITVAEAFNTTKWVAILIETDRSRYLLPGAGWQILEYRVNYIKTPADIHIDLVTPANQIDCELSSALHDEVVLKAVQMASASIIPDQGKYQVNSAEDIKQQ